ncbi:hypothetical protein HZS_7466 [Henneguya salminicola]|uniref:Tetraspanin-11 (Trinotate prediction) n=1 Tax=Henneguya salminicola TaxID=69463 RepID=A0A6G3MIA0_HENSL|nr:hypothetical protein HZS_7466 [Henneguya salminicola]
MTNRVEGYHTGSYNSAFVDMIQDKFNCCGMFGIIDWTNRTLQIPDSCCKREHRATNCSAVPSNLNDVGCIIPLEKGFLVSIPYLLAFLAIVGLSFIFLGALAAIGIRDASRYEYQHL